MSNVPAELEKDLEAALGKYPEIGAALQRFVREQVELQEWRERRYGGSDWDEAKNIVAEAKRRAEQSNLSRKEAIDNMMAARERILAELESSSVNG